MVSGASSHSGETATMTAGTATSRGVSIAALVLVAAYTVQGFMSRFAQHRAMVLGETVFAALREQCRTAKESLVPQSRRVMVELPDTTPQNGPIPRYD